MLRLNMIYGHSVNSNYNPFTITETFDVYRYLLCYWMSKFPADLEFIAQEIITAYTNSCPYKQ